MASHATVRQRFPASRRRLLAAALALLLVPAAARAEVYTVQKGETLYRISRKFDVPVAVLQSLNGLGDPSQLQVGAQLRLPERYSVQKGDTLYGIARAHKLPLTDLIRLNGIREGDTLRAGQVLYVPGKAATQGTAAKPAPAVQPAATKPAAVAVKDSLLWPLQGRRESLSGRITGTAIYGAAGQAVVSVSSGRVVWAGPYRGFSRVVLIEAKSGYTYVYAGNEETLVAVGDSVEPGAEIGRLGTNVHQGVPQLYFLVYRNGEPVDPAAAPRS
jgi:murein DD-endopeptidase MepM/ murein hydrolase activator NlpD